MRKHLITVTFAAIGALAYAAPAAAQAGGSSGAGDARAMQEQAQIHPTEANQAPSAVPGGIAWGEVYLPGAFASPEVVEPAGPAYAPAGRAGVLPPYEALVGAPLGNCQPDRDWTGYGWRNVEVCH